MLETNLPGQFPTVYEPKSSNDPARDEDVPHFTISTKDTHPPVFPSLLREINEFPTRIEERSIERTIHGVFPKIFRTFKLVRMTQVSLPLKARTVCYYTSAHA